MHGNTGKWLTREALKLPWREGLWALRRLEARGVIRGGRFVSGFVGEQFALPEAVQVLRRVRRRERTGEVVKLSAVDPLNLTEEENALVIKRLREELTR